MLPLDTRRTPLAVGGTIALTYLLVAVAATWPVAATAFTRVPHDLGDPVMSLTLLGWNASVPPLSARWWDGIGFYPLRGTLALSDPRLGVSLVAAPVIWATGSLPAGYAAAFVLSFALSAMAAHVLVYSLTRNHAAALVAGCAYGFAPYRVAHLAHLELLASYWMPIALAGLHRHAATGSRRALAVFGAAFALQGLFCSYYLPYFGVLVGLWLLFLAASRAPLPRIVSLAAASCLAVAAISPVLIPYVAAHRTMGLYRGIEEIQRFSADLSGLWAAAPELAVWPWHAAGNAERFLFPGMTVVLVAMAGLAVVVRAAPDSTIRRRARRVLLAAAVALGLVTIAAVAGVPLKVAFAGVSLSASSFRKPLSLACAALAAWALLAPRPAAAIRARSVYAFYLGASALMMLCALGPDPTLFGVPVLYKAPYAWLMELPGFSGSLRAPARFGMLAALTLAASAGLAWHRLSASWPGRRTALATAAVAVAIVLEGWAAPLGVRPVPEAFPWPDGCAGIPRLELPFGDVEPEVAAQYRAFLAGVRSVNGASGFLPAHLSALRVAIANREPDAVTALAEHGPICIAVDRRKADAAALDAWLRTLPAVTPLEAPEAPAALRFGRLERQQAVRPAPVEPGVVPIAGLTATPGDVAVGGLEDDDPTTAWVSRGPQRASDAMTVTLGCRARVGEVLLSQGIYPGGFPRRLAVDVAGPDGRWRTAWRGPLAGAAVRAALADPRQPQLRVPIGAADVRVLRLRAEAGAPEHWAIAELSVRGQCP